MRERIEPVAEPEPELVLGLASIDRAMGERVGGKAANLGELAGAGFRVPPGFCVTTDAYGQAYAGIASEVDPLIDQLDAPDTPVEATTASIRERFATAALTAALRDRISRAYAALGDGARVAVRSSATAEDLPEASFAGQQDTFLGVSGVEALLDAVRHCWASLWTARAVAYRASNGIDQHDVRLAVVVQRMVDAETAGVLFTANPVTGRRKDVVIDANAGLGESVVSGWVDPDHVVFQTDTGRVAERRVGEKAVMVRMCPSGGTETVEAERAATSCLTDAQVSALAVLGRRIERHYGAPQDIEWAIDRDGASWITQSRPMTTLFPVPPTDRAQLRVYYSANVGQGLYRPLTPLGLAMLKVLGSKIWGQTGGWSQVSGWLFIDMTSLFRSRLSRALASRGFAVGEARSARVVEALAKDPRLRASGRKTPGQRPPMVAMLRQQGRGLGRVVTALRRPGLARERAFRAVDSVQEALTGAPAGTGQRHLDAARAGMVEVAAPAVSAILPIMLAITLLHRAALLVLGRSVSSVELLQVLRGVPHNITTEMDLELWGLTEHVRPDPDALRLFAELTPDELAARYADGRLPGELTDALDRFLTRYGHRGVTEIDAGVPRWAEDPGYILGALAGYLRTDDPGRAAPAVFRRSAAEAEAAAGRIVARLGATNPLRARVAAFVLDRLRQLSGLRELPKYCIALAIAHARRELLAAGAELVAAGVLDAAGDVCFLDLDEVAEALDGTDYRDLVARRRAIHARELRRRHVPRLLLSDGTDPETTLPLEAAEGALVGAAVSPGTATGTARVIRDPRGAAIEPGDILVAPSTDPGWTPLFMTAGGLVMEMGGPASHGATVAREYGIPAVAGVPNATSLITTGEPVTVDGSAGTVSPVTP